MGMSAKPAVGGITLCENYMIQSVPGCVHDNRSEGTCDFRPHVQTLSSVNKPGEQAATLLKYHK